MNVQLASGDKNRAEICFAESVLQTCGTLYGWLPL